mmetsp:Transcript_5309/g.7048  ORF Transcript_5309/g.7048 Transcript_5309/m.7048 type:complete len:140 (+) Transcript_5309:167-586(+)
MKTNPDFCYTNCISCRELLKVPSSYRCITCPKCETNMNVSTDPMQSSENTRPIKRKRDPGAPRQAANAYMVFCKEHRSRVKQQHPHLPFGKIGAKLGAMWRIMSEEAKAPFEAKASLDRERFRKEVDEYHRRSSALTRH